MEGKVSEKNLLEAEERPSDRYDNNRDAQQRNEETSINNTLDFTSLSLSLNNSEHDHKNQEQPLTQAGLLRIKLQEAKKENQNLRAMLNQITESYTALQNHLLLAMQKQQQSSQPRNYYDLQKLNRQDVIEKPVLPTWKFLDIGWPSPSEGFASARFNEKNIGSKLSSACMVEGDYINNQITPEGVKSIADQASEASGRKARVSIRARSDCSLMGDGCQWRKYGQKTAKGNPCPRAYYRCSMGTACPVRKQVQRCAKDNTVLITTYEGNHNHPLPPAARSMASTTSAALNMFLSGSTTSTTAHGSTLPNLGLFPSLSGSVSTGLASFSPSASCPTITLDLTLPSNNSLQFQRATSLNHCQPFPLPLHGCSRQSEGLNLYSKSPNVITPENNLLLADLVGEAIAKDPSFKAAFVAAISSFTGATQNLNSHNQVSKSGHEPSSNMPALLHQSCTTGLI